MKSLVLFLFLFLLTFPVKSQQYEVHKYGIREGLSIELTKSVTQDTFGFIWVATDEGIARFDGYRFKSYNSFPEIAFSKEIIRRKNGNLLSVSDLGIFEITPRLDSAIVRLIAKGSREFSLNNIWFPKNIFESKDGSIFTSEQGAIVKIKNGKFKKYLLQKEDYSFNFLRAHYFCELESGELIVITHNGGIYLFDFNSDKLISIGKVNSATNISAVQYIGNLKFVLGNNLGITKVELKKEDDRGYKISNSKRYFPELNVSCLLFEDSVMVVGTWDRGLYSFKLKKEFEELQKLSAVGDIKINNLFAGQGNDVWLCTESGLILLNYSLFNRLVPTEIKQYIQDIITIKDNKSFISDGNSLYRVNLKGPVGSAELVYSAPNLVIISICRFKDGVLASLSDGELIYISDKGEQQSIQIEKKGKFFKYLGYGENEDIWMIEEGAKEITNLKMDLTVKHYDVSHCPIDAYSIISTNEKGETFAAGPGKNISLIKFDPKTDKFNPVKLETNGSVKGEITVNDIDYDRANSPVLATTNGVFYIANGKLLPLDPSFAGMNARSITVDGVNQNYWVGTSDGLYLYDGQSISHFDVISGLPSKTIGSRTLTIDPSGNIWVGTAEGVAVMKGVFKISLSESPKLILSNKKNGLNFSFYDKSIEVPEGENWFIRASNFSYPARSTLYQYRFSKDDEWINLSEGNIIPLEDIGSGTFTVEVRAREHGNHSWSLISRMEFTILAHWYKRWWALLIWSILAIALIYAAARFYARNLQKENLTLEKLVSERTAELSSKNSELEKSQNEIVSKNKALEELLIELREINSTKDKMFSIISHDLKNPFTTIMGFAEILKDDIEEMTQPEVNDFISRIHRTSRRTYELLENLLGWSRAQSDSLTISKIEVNIRSIAKKVTDLATDTATEKELTLKTEIEENLKVFADPNALETILRNLVMNAIKFSMQGKEITIKATQIDSVVKISVEDQGVGMDEETIGKLFRNDLHYSTSGTQQERGTGLGLILCKELVEKHGGTMTVKSKPAEGSIFTFTLPVQQLDQV